MMRSLLHPTWFVLAVLWIGVATGRSADRPLPPFAEVYEALRSNLPTMTEEELNRAAVEGLIEALHPKVLLADESAGANTADAQVRVRTFDDAYGYVRIGGVESEAAKGVTEALKALISTNKMRGVVLDLRFSGGKDYREAAKLADLFVRREYDLLDFGEGMVRSENKWDAVMVPLVVLVNGRTHSAAEVLAGVLRQTGAALLIGTATAGEATVRREVELGEGLKLLLGGTPVKLGNGEGIPEEGLRPDVAVQVSPDREAAYLEDPYREFPREGANALAASGPGPRRINEAGLVRERRILLDPSADSADEAVEAAPDKPLVRDPALARALDLLKGLAVLKKTR